MNSTEFAYTTYIKTTPEKLWKAITTPEFQSQYWSPGMESDWRKGSAWRAINDGKVSIHGQVLESDPPKKLVMTWVDSSVAEPQGSHVTFTIEPVGEMVRLDVIHANLQSSPTVAQRVSGGWPRVLASLKSLLETGQALDTWAGVQRACSRPANA